MSDREVVSHDGIIQWYCQVVATDPDSVIGPNSEPDNIMARHKDPYHHEPAEKPMRPTQLASEGLKIRVLMRTLWPAL